VKQLIDRMLEIDPTKRITAQQALKHPWIANRDAIAASIHRQVKKFMLYKKMTLIFQFYFLFDFNSFLILFRFIFNFIAFL
jgi:serine/threonine protein kinase